MRNLSFFDFYQKAYSSFFFTLKSITSLFRENMIMDKNNPNFFAFNRRQLLKTSAALATVSQLPLPFTSKAETKPIVESTEKVVWNTCPGNCHSRCALR